MFSRQILSNGSAAVSRIVSVPVGAGNQKIDKTSSLFLTNDFWQNGGFTGTIALGTRNPLLRSTAKPAPTTSCELNADTSGLTFMGLTRHSRKHRLLQLESATSENRPVFRQAQRIAVGMTNRMLGVTTSWCSNRNFSSGCIRMVNKCVQEICEHEKIGPKVMEI